MNLAWELKALRLRIFGEPKTKQHYWRMPRPADVFILGAPKSGTSSLHAYLSEHPGVHGVPDKEHHYYCELVDKIEREGLTRATRRRMQACQRDLDAAKPGQLKLESTPNYLWHPEAALRIYKQNPKAKLIVMLRDHADRVRSNYRHFRRAGQEQRDWYEFQIEGIPLWTCGLPYGRKHLQHGEYGAHLRRLSKVFPREQVLILQLADLQADPVATMQRVAEFLSLDAKPFEDMEYPVHNRAWIELKQGWVPGARAALDAYYAEDKEILKQDFGIIVKGGGQ